MSDGREALINGPEATQNWELTPMRIHEMAIQYWCHRNFMVRDGYPVPVVFAKPMDAFSHFQELWKKSENPFNYLLELRDENGTPLYEPYPSPARLPLLIINRRRQSYRNYGTFSIHRRRTVSWPTVTDEGVDGHVIHREDLGNVRVRNRPIGVNFHLDVSFWCLRPDTQALFMQRVWNAFWRSGGVPQTWIPVRYPTEEGKLQVRMVLESDVVDATPDDPGQNQVKYVTNFSVRVEGWQLDMRDLVLPAFWTLITRVNAEVSPGVLQNLYTLNEDLREHVQNPNILARDGVPGPEPPTPPDDYVAPTGPGFSGPQIYWPNDGTT